MKLWAVATVNLPGLSRGEAALVDPDYPVVRRRLASMTLELCTDSESAALDRMIRRSTEGGNDEAAA